MAPFSRTDLDRWLVTARDAAAAAAAVHRAGSGRIDIVRADSKGFSDFVSRVDLDAQDAALSVIRARHPDHLIMAEEEGQGDDALPEDDTPIWVVDPLDGTTNFLHGHPNHAASVALAVGGTPVAACVHASATSEVWEARTGGGAWRSGRPIRVSQPRGLPQSLIATGFTFKGGNDVDRFGRQMAAMRRTGAGIRRCGAAAIDLCYVADGRYEGFWEGFLSPWDYAAGWLVAAEAGGVAERVEGEALTLTPGSLLVANHPRTATAIRDVIDSAG
jgi:myo-inositol-1(or 4)-monophosphatase